MERALLRRPHLPLKHPQGLRDMRDTMMVRTSDLSTSRTTISTS
jgi:hypothetical protein